MRAAQGEWIAVIEDHCILLGLPVLVLFVLAWALGEMAGYLAGAADTWSVWSDSDRTLKTPVSEQ